MASRERYMEEFIKRIEDAKTHLPDDHKDKEWMDGFNQGLDWAISSRAEKSEGSTTRSQDRRVK